MGFWKKQKRQRHHFVVTLRLEGYPTEGVPQWAVSEAQAVTIAKKLYKRRHGLSDSVFVSAEVHEEAPPRRRRRIPTGELIQHQLFW